MNTYRIASLLVVLSLSAALAKGSQSLEAAPAGASVEEGVALYRAGSLLAALTAFLKAVELEPQSVEIRIWLGATYIALDRLEEALEALNAALKLDGRSGAAHLFLGVAYFRLGELDEARAALDRALTFAPNRAYATSASAWLDFLSSDSASPPAPTAAICPKPSSASKPKPPALTPSPPGLIEISGWQFTVDGDALRIEGEISNLSEHLFSNIGIMAVGYGLDGRQVGNASTTVEGGLEGEDVRDFALTLGTRPPVIWVQLRITRFDGRPREDPLHALLIPVDMDEYEELARRRIAVAGLAVPAAQAAAHTVCLRIRDTGGFPVSAASVRLTLNGTGSDGKVQQARTARISAGTAASLQVAWQRPVRVALAIEVNAVEFLELPPTLPESDG